ncbi:MAG: transcription elongation factor GreA [Patescibacteria group bacterium]
MPNDELQYLTHDKRAKLEKELRELKETKIPQTAKRIDEARQMGDLSENAEYHAAREEMSWLRSREKELVFIIDNSQIIEEDGKKRSNNVVSVGSTIEVKVNDKKKSFHIVGAQEADPANGRISNESPLGQAFLGKEEGDKVEVKVPAGVQTYKIIEIL